MTKDMEKALRWLRNRGYDAKLVPYWGDRPGAPDVLKIRVDTDYAGFYPPESVYAAHDEINAYIRRHAQSLRTETSPARVALLIREA